MAKSQNLLDRLLNTPDIAKIVPRLEPGVLHRVIQTCGLEDCVEFVALATPAQLARILDVDIWRVRTPGVDEEFDADRFGVWITVLMQSGAAVAAEKLIGLETELVIAGFARHVGVFDHAAVSAYMTLDGEYVPGRPPSRGPTSEIGGYVIEARRTSAWEPIVELLAFLEVEHRDYFHRVMRGCVRLSSGRREEDGFHGLLEEAEQTAFDLASGRHARRERQGYVTPAQAHAFLRGGRDLRLDGDRPPLSPIARAYFLSIESSTPETDADPVHQSDEAASEYTPDAPSPPEPRGVAAVVEVLQEAGVLAHQPRALLGTADQQTSRVPFIEAHVATHPASGEELAYLTNVIVAGCSVQGRPFTAREASDAAVSTCNLGLENWPSHWSDRDLVTAFQIGWTILHRDVCMYVAQRLIDVLASLRCTDRDIHLQLDALRRQLILRVRDLEPWRARNALDVILMLDAPAWAILLALIDECPVAHAALSASRKSTRTINPTEFEFISQNSQIDLIREFTSSLHSVLML
jgi:hypothetical protein